MVESPVVRRGSLVRKVFSSYRSPAVVLHIANIIITFNSQK